jgi:hypothetical protein
MTAALATPLLQSATGPTLPTPPPPLDLGDALRRVFDLGDVVHLPAALPPGYCTATMNAVARLTFSAYPKTEGAETFEPILKYGPTMFDHFHLEDVAPYFDEAECADSALRGAFTESRCPDPLAVAIDALTAVWDAPVRVATEHGRPYFAGVLRDIRSGAIPHVDRARVETPDLTIGESRKQISMLFYLRVPERGGALRVYDKEPTRYDDDHLVDGYGYRPQAVQGVTFRGVTPSVGSVVLFPTTRVHSVDAVEGEGRRVTWSTFIGLQPDGSLRLWS